MLINYVHRYDGMGTDLHCTSIRVGDWIFEFVFVSIYDLFFLSIASVASFIVLLLTLLKNTFGMLSSSDKLLHS